MTKIKNVIICKFVGFNGVQYDTEAEAIKSFELEKTKGFDTFLASFYGKQLLKKFALTDHGVWKIHGEDPNFDMGGFHHMPHLGTFQGTLEEAIMYATKLNGWGYGGNIEAHVNPPVIILS